MTGAPEPEPLLRWFAYGHLAGPLADVSAKFAVLANTLAADLPRTAERSVALRKLLEAKDAAVRAALEATTTVTAHNPDAVLFADLSSTQSNSRPTTTTWTPLDKRGPRNEVQAVAAEDAARRERQGMVDEIDEQVGTEIDAQAREMHSRRVDEINAEIRADNTP